jgi:hypothetical protein
MSEWCNDSSGYSGKFIVYNNWDKSVAKNW